MIRKARSHKGPVQLRKNVMELYGPGGGLRMEGSGFTETCVLNLELDELEVINETSM